MSKKKEFGESERKHFINILSAYAKRKHLEVIVVFDAGPFMFPSTEEIKGITVKYSGSQHTADDIIMRLLQQYQPGSIILASSDREIRDAAKRYTIESVPAEEFIARLTEHEPIKKSSVQKAVKTTDASSALIDTWLEQTKPKVKLEDLTSAGPKERRSPAHKESKKERERAKKINKL